TGLPVGLRGSIALRTGHPAIVFRDRCIKLMRGEMQLESTCNRRVCCQKLVAVLPEIDVVHPHKLVSVRRKSAVSTTHKSVERYSTDFLWTLRSSHFDIFC